VRRLADVTVVRRGEPIGGMLTRARAAEIRHALREGKATVAYLRSMDAPVTAAILTLPMAPC
jgi:hypothetical protein